MADVIVAKIGLGQGPWVFTGGFPSPRLQVAGSENYKVKVELADHPDGEVRVVEFEQAGPMTVPPSTYARVTLESECPSLICRIHSR